MRAPLRLGIAGLGAAGHAFVPALRRHPGFDWVAAAEPDAAERADAARDHGVAVFDTLDAMLAAGGLDAVYLATPTPLHAAQVRQVAGAGLHVLVEKPMAVTLADARAMVRAADAAGVVLAVGHSHSHDAPIAAMRALIEGGTLGRVRMVHSWCHSDWVRRPRRPDELRPERGGGVTHRQGAHQFDILRLLCGGVVRRVRAQTFDWLPERSTVGAHAAWLEFDDGVLATAVYNGYGHVLSPEFTFGIGEWGMPVGPGASPQPMPSPASNPADEASAKRARARHAIPDLAPHPPFFGLTLVSCERGEIRQSPAGLWVADASGRREVVLPVDRSPRESVLDEFHAAITGQAPALHGGRWGLATLEVCLAAHRASRTGRAQRLREQVAVRPGIAWVAAR